MSNEIEGDVRVIEYIESDMNFRQTQRASLLHSIWAPIHHHGPMKFE